MYAYRSNDPRRNYVYVDTGGDYAVALTPEEARTLAYDLIRYAREAENN